MYISNKHSNWWLFDHDFESLELKISFSCIENAITTVSIHSELNWKEFFEVSIIRHFIHIYILRKLFDLNPKGIQFAKYILNISEREFSINYVWKPIIKAQFTFNSNGLHPALFALLLERLNLRICSMIALDAKLHISIFSIYNKQWYLTQ